MLTWQDYPFFFVITTLLWAAGGLIQAIGRTKLRNGTLTLWLSLAGILCLALFMLLLGFSLDRPILRTLAETRLWYALFISLIGLFLLYQWHFREVYFLSFLMAWGFLAVNYLFPDTFNKNLMPALRSGWFIPHVIVYMVGYALLGASSVTGIKGLVWVRIEEDVRRIALRANQLAVVGFAFLTMGLIFGALWANEAWGRYWTWDPKETWALITWLVYMIYFHVQFRYPNRPKRSLIILALAFAAMMACWFGLSYLPTGAMSLHVYN